MITMSKPLAYIVGVYLGDAYISGSGRCFEQYSIDKDFLVNVSKNLSRISKYPVTIKEAEYKTSSGYRLYCFDRDLCDYLVAATRNKQCVPDTIPLRRCPETQALCEGYLDAEGWVAKSKKLSTYTKHPLYRIGVGNTNLNVLSGVVYRMESFGIQHGKLICSSRKDAKDFYTFEIEKRSYMKSGMKFSIRRKQARLEEYIKDIPKRPWNKGLTKYSSDLVKQIGKSSGETKKVNCANGTFHPESNFNTSQRLNAKDPYEDRDTV
jgi:hypothetical protein